MDGAPVVIPGAKPRAILTMLGLHGGSVVPADVLMELLWGDDPPRTAAKALQTHISSLRHALGDGFVLTEGIGWRLNTAETDASRYQGLAKSGRDAFGAGDTSGAVARFDEAVTLWRGIPELPDCRRGASEKTRWVEGHAALVEDRADALLATGRAAEIVGDLEAAVGDAPLRERRWGQLMLALYRAGRQGEALGAFKRVQAVLANELGVDPGPDLRRLEAAIVAQDSALDVPAVQQVPSSIQAVTFLLTDIEGSTAAWEADADAMAIALARHDELVEQVVTSRGGRLIKTRGEGDATFSVFERPSAAAAAALELQDAILHEPWALQAPMRIRVALHTGEAELRDGDYFGRAVNRAARLRSLAAGGQILCSGATAELVVDSLRDDVVLADLGMRELRNLARPEHVFELRFETEDRPEPTASAGAAERPDLPAVLAGPGPFVGRSHELAQLSASWQVALDGGARAALIAGEPGVGKTRLAGEWSRLAYAQGAVVLYGRSDEDLGAPYQPFAEALRALVPCVGTGHLRGMRGIEALLPLVPGLIDVLPDLAAPPRADPDTERYALFDAVVAMLGVASADVPIVLVLDDLHWAAKPTLLLLRHLLRFGEHARVQVVGTYRSTDLDRSHPLAAMLADLHRDGSADRIALTGLDEADVSTYVAQAGYDDEELARALSAVTGGNPFFLIEALRHVEESGGHWDPGTLPQGVREAVSRRLSRLPEETNKALAAAAVVGSRFALELVEKVVDQDLVDAFDGARQAGIVIEEPGGQYRFNHAIVRQSLLAELASVRRMRLHQRIATTLEGETGADDELLGDLAHHYFECAWAGNALKAVEYCRRAADQAMARLAYEGAADLYDHALHALEELDDELPDLDDQRVELLVARCEALLAAGDVTSAAGAVSQLQAGTRDSARLAAWATCFDGQLSMLVDPERLDEIESAVGTAASVLAELDDAAGEAKAHTVRAGCLARLGRIGDCEVALDNALTAARRAGEHRRVNAVLAGAPLAALWGPNPVPRAGGRCLDVVRLLRITTDSPAVEATSTRCQAVLEAFRGRAAAARRMIDSARRTVNELGLRHALLEVEHFAGIVELVVDDPAAAEPHLRLAYNGFRRMRLDADAAEIAALLARACLLLDRDSEAEELCGESERLAGHALRASIAWRTVRAQLLARGGSYDEAQRVAEEAVALAERTDALVDHGDACLALATVLATAGDAARARAAAERAVELYERKGAVALAEKARGLVGERDLPTPPADPEVPVAEFDNACVRAIRRLSSAVDRQAWAEYEEMLASNVTVESHRKIVGFPRAVFSSTEWTQQVAHLPGIGAVRHDITFVATRGDRLALSRLVIATADQSPGAPEEEWLQLQGLDEEGRIELAMWFDLEDIDAAIAELDSLQARFEAPVEMRTAAVEAYERAAAAIDAGTWDEFELMFAPEGFIESRRKLVGFKRTEFSPHDVMHQTRCDLENGIMRANHAIVAARGERFALARVSIGTADESPGAPQDELLQVYGIDEAGRIALQIWFDVDDIDAAMAELDAQQARFEQEHPRAHLENAASRADDRLVAFLGNDRLDEIGTLFTDDAQLDDRRQGVRCQSNGRAMVVDCIRAIPTLGATTAKSTLALRGDRLCLNQIRFEDRATQPAAFCVDAVEVTEVDTHGLMLAKVVFDLDDFESAIEELDTRYLAGEAAPYTQPWSAVACAFAAVVRHEFPSTTTGFKDIDHRALTAMGAGDLKSYLRVAFAEMADNNFYVETVHRLTELGAVVTHMAKGATREDFNVEWRVVDILLTDGGLLSRCEMFDPSDLDAALTRFDELSHRASRLENAASRADDQLIALFGGDRLDEIGALFTEDTRLDDRRQGFRCESTDRETAVANIRAIAAFGATVTKSTLALRGDRLCLSRIRFENPATFCVEALEITEVDTQGLMVAKVDFDADDIDAAFDELDARYLAGEAAPHAQTWSAIVRAYAGFNRRELAATTPDWVNVDHRRGAAFASGDMIAYIQAAWVDSPDTRIHIAAVHRLSDLGAVVTHVAQGISHDGFEAEWRDTHVLMTDGDMVCRSELFDEADLAGALAKFDELSRPARRLENAASQATDRFAERFAARDWDAMGKAVTDDISFDDRRRVISAGLQTGRNSFIENFQIAADLGATQSPNAVATRGERVVLARARFALGSGAPEEFGLELLHVIKVDADNRIAATVTFDHNDFDAAIDQLDAWYLAGEAADHAHTWSVVAQAFAATNRRQMPEFALDLASIDHRRARGFAPGELGAYIRATWDLTPDVTSYPESVHQLSNGGAVLTQAVSGTSRGGFDAEWREIVVVTVEDDLIDRIELFDEADLDAALARFEELRPTPGRLRNTASRTYERLQKCLAERDPDAMATMLADNFCGDDRRHVVSSAVRHGRDAALEDARAVIDLNARNIATTVIATRGECLALRRSRYTVGGEPVEAFHVDLLDITVVDTDGRIAALITFDPDDIDAAFEELDTRYLSGEAAAHAHAWSVIANAYAAFNRRETPPTTPDWVNIDHRRANAFAPGDLVAITRAAWDDAPNVRAHLEAVHRLSPLGAVVTQVADGTSQDGFDAEWRQVHLLTVDCDLLARCEVFDEADVDAALARFDELSARFEVRPPRSRLVNAATQTTDRTNTLFADGRFDEIGALFADQLWVDDRRRGLRRESTDRATEVANIRAVAELGIVNISTTPLAVRGNRLCLNHVILRGREAFGAEALVVTEVDEDESITTLISFDPDDIDAAFEELDTRYAAGEAAPHAHAWSVVKAAYAVLNRRGHSGTQPNWIDIDYLDHRRLVGIMADDLGPSLRAIWDITPDATIYVEAVNQLSDAGVVVTHAATATSRDGFEAEWRDVCLLLVDGDVVSRGELFDESDLDAALARFDELSRAVPRLENAATAAWTCLIEAFNRHDVDGLLACITADGRLDDRRKGLRAVMEGAERQRAFRELFTAPSSWQLEVEPIALRGSRLSLTHEIGCDTSDVDHPVTIELLTVVELGEGDLVRDTASFDPDDLDAAFAELDARYLAGEAAAHARTWTAITQAYDAVNKRRLPSIKRDFVSIDHRRAVAFAPGEMTAFVQATWESIPDVSIYIETVHRLSNLGVVVTHTAHGTSNEGFEAEWREVSLAVVGGEITRCELFDEADLDAALARFDELSQPPVT
ncbi:BTAD domain-containing putative transcriptional regulator [Mycobacterium sp. NPDC050441]|uniref:BTAD domain-containing putative transcriptional regulator n=1 Tax=Mycobacterium sp. NPDC050441 TaxID=3155403 RepID=UPI00340AAE86